MTRRGIRRSGDTASATCIHASSSVYNVAPSSRSNGSSSRPASFCTWSVCVCHGVTTTGCAVLP
eukprot:5702270-Prymnesium_polylepis.1